MLLKSSNKLAAAAVLSLMLATGCATSSTNATSASTENSSTNTETTTAAADTSTESTESNTAAVASTDAEPAESDTSAVVEASTSEDSNIRYFTDGNGVAIRGTDPVAYFTQGAPQRGRSEFTHTWRGATWKFASAENRDRFIEEPERYAPQYGGFCAWAVSQGYTASTVPEAWKIVDGRLYLNYSKRVQRTWEQNIPGNIAKANSNWPGVLAGS